MESGEQNTSPHFASLHAGYLPTWSVACAVRADLREAADLVVRMAHATRIIFLALAQFL